MKKYKIFYIHGGGDTIGGIETYLMYSLKSHKIYEPYLGIIRYGKYFEYLKKNGVKNLIDLKGGRLREIFKTIRAIYNGVKFVKKNKIKLIISHGAHSWIFGGIISKIAGVKSVFYLAGDIKSSDFKELITGISLRIKPDLYVANSKFVAKSIEKFLSKNYKINYLGVDEKLFEDLNEKEARKRLENEFNFSSEKIIISLIGRIQIGKGQDIAINAYKLMRNKNKCVLLIVGEPTFDKDKEFISYLREISKDEKNIIFTGARTDIPLVMKGSDIILHTPRFPESFGLVIVEGMLSKKPVIASSLGGACEIIENGKDGFLVEPENFKELSNLMDLLVENPDLRKKIGMEGYKKAKSKFTASISIKNLEEIISKYLLKCQK